MFNSYKHTHHHLEAFLPANASVLVLFGLIQWGKTNLALMFKGVFTFHNCLKWYRCYITR